MDVTIATSFQPIVLIYCRVANSHIFQVKVQIVLAYVFPIQSAIQVQL